MSFEVVTKGGEIFRGGFFGPDTSRIMLGELPVITMRQFTEFATETLLSALPFLESSKVEAIKSQISQAQRHIDGAEVRETENPYSGFESINVLMSAFYKARKDGDERAAQEAGEAAARAVSEASGNTCVFYGENPFVFKAGSVVIGDQYEVEIEEFASFTANYLGGGALGWGEDGVPSYVASSVDQLLHA